MLATSVCGMDAQTFQANKTLSLIYGISYYSAELFIIALFRKIMLQRTANRPRSHAQHSQLILYFLFPCASFVMLVILLYVTSGHNIEEFVSAGCCILILFQTSQSSSYWSEWNMPHRKENSCWHLISRFSYNRKTWPQQANFIQLKGRKFMTFGRTWMF